MDATAKDTNAIHRVKRPYVRKATMEGADVGEAVVVLPVVVMTGKSDAVNYANRVWSGQSIDVPMHERKERVLNALRGQNLPTDGLTFTPEGIA